jgi:arsenite-transporting ATPase
LADSLSDFPSPRNLDILELDAQECLATFKEYHREELREIALRGTFFDNEDISQFLDLSLPGLDEIMSFLEISRWVEEGSYDCIVVDTAPTGHTLRLLVMPELIRKWIEALDALLAKHRYMKRLFGGSYHCDELDKLLLELSGSVRQMEALLQDPIRCRFVPVMLAEALSICETVTLLDELERSRIPVTEIVVNGLYSESPCAVCSDRFARQVTEIIHISQRLSRYSVWGVPMYPQEMRSSEPLEMFWENVSALQIPPCEKEGTKHERRSPGPQVEQPGTLPSLETKLVVFAGKGGVGKTTLACATAIRMARDLRGSEVFLFSTDPAHSLSSCLDVAIGPRPRRLVPGLTAMEIDAPAEFEILKNQYAEELERFLDAISPNFDFTLDREAMERIMDLSPPGVDEVMALTLAMDFLAQGRYDVFVLDSAPTGHLIRLLETPELIDQWLRLFFNLFLKYRRVFRLPGISQRLVQISKNLKILQTLLRDPARCTLFAVTILTEMAFQETKDLLAACERMGVSVSMMFLNLATPAGLCPLCSALHRREWQVKKKYEETFAKKHRTLVYRQGEPRGLRDLGELGETLYKPTRNISIEGRTRTATDLCLSGTQGAHVESTPAERCPTVLQGKNYA